MPRRPEYPATDLASVKAHADAFARPAFRVGNRLRSLVWKISWLLLYRPMHAWRPTLLRLFGATIGSEPRFYSGCGVWAAWNRVAENRVATADGEEIHNPPPMRLGSVATRDLERWTVYGGNPATTGRPRHRGAAASGIRPVRPDSGDRSA